MGAKYRKYGFFLIVDGAALQGWPLVFFGDPEPWIFNPDYDTDSWVAVGKSGCTWDVFESAGAEQIELFSKQAELYEVWGRGEPAFSSFMLSCPAPRSVLVQISDGTLRPLVDVSVAELTQT